MKLGVGRLNALTVADSCENARNPSRMGIFYPADSGGWVWCGRGL